MNYQILDATLANGFLFVKIGGNHNLSSARFRFNGSPNNEVQSVVGIGHFTEMVGGSNSYNLLGQLVQTGGQEVARTTLAFNVPENWILIPSGNSGLGGSYYNMLGQLVQGNPAFGFNIAQLVGTVIHRLATVQFARKQRLFNITDPDGVFHHEHQDALPNKSRHR